MDMVYRSIVMEIAMKESMLITCRMDMEYISILMEEFMKVNFSMINSMVKVSTHTKQGKCLLVNL